MRSLIDKLYNIISGLVISLEDELNQLNTNDNNRNTSKQKKNITDSLHKIVSLMTQLNKLEKQDNNEIDEHLSDEDQKIIEEFLRKYGDVDL